jgi:hypothetical protein
MKFTVDLEKKTISIHGPFMVKEIDELLSLLNIDDKDTWLIEKYEQPIQWAPTYPYIPQQPIVNPYIVNPYIGDGPVVHENPYIYGTANTGGSITLSNGNSNLTYTNGSIVSGTTTNTWSVQNHDGKSI